MPRAAAPVLRIRHAHGGRIGHRVELSIEGSDGKTLQATSEFRFGRRSRDEEDLRWYLEDYLQFPIHPAPVIAARIERRIEELGVTLFGSVFGAGKAASLWRTAETRLGKLRIEIDASPADVALPWELLRSSAQARPLSIEAAAIVRTGPSAKKVESWFGEELRPIRILLVISRPGRRRDLPFRSVARHLVRTSGASGSPR